MSSVNNRPLQCRDLVDPLSAEVPQEGMAAHKIFAPEITWTERPGELQSWGVIKIGVTEQLSSTEQYMMRYSWYHKK